MSNVVWNKAYAARAEAAWAFYILKFISVFQT